MYRSILTIDVGLDPDRPRPGRLWLRNIYHVHQRLCMAFPLAQKKARDAHFLEPFAPEHFSAVHVPRSPETNFLYRIDPGRPGRVVIEVRSALEPDWDYAFHNAPELLCRSCPPQVQPWRVELARGELLRYVLVANPTRKIATWTKAQRQGGEPPLPGTSKNGKRVPVRPGDLGAWLAERANAAGFSLVAPPAISTLFYRFWRRPNGDDPLSGGKQKAGKIFAARFVGRLRVEDPERLHAALECGIGPAKAFGCGMLSLLADSDVSVSP